MARPVRPQAERYTDDAIGLASRPPSRFPVYHDESRPDQSLQSGRCNRIYSVECAALENSGEAAEEEKVNANNFKNRHSRFTAFSGCLQSPDYLDTCNSQELPRLFGDPI